MNTPLVSLESPRLPRANCARRLDPEAIAAPAPAPLPAAPAPYPAAASAAAATRALRPARPPLPAWMDEVERLRGNNEPHEAKWDRQWVNREAVGGLNASDAARSGTWRLDVLLLGDSLTWALQRPPQAAWKRHFGRDGRTPNTLALGACGGRADAWRGGGRLVQQQRSADGVRSPQHHPESCTRSPPLSSPQACLGQLWRPWPGASCMEGSCQRCSRA